MALVTEIEATILFRIVIALILGLALGIQRERKKTEENSLGLAGLRTHTIVTIGSALVSAIGFVAISEDPLRLASSILTGIGFIGAGTIIADKNRVKGLVNAATIWTAATIGMAAGLGFYVSATVVTLMTIVILELKRFEKVE
ncbi:MAG TPA: MgtC/SapB family protein [Candidatus Nanoarchaeia archaeon]|nr:MgtC/SapB family protein [Candidatus Nanoarchaeia archaeon]